MEKRYGYRQPVAFQVRVTATANPGVTVSGETLDISESGIGVCLPLLLTLGSLVQLEIADSVMYGFVAHMSGRLCQSRLLSAISHGAASLNRGGRRAFFTAVFPYRYRSNRGFDWNIWYIAALEGEVRRKNAQPAAYLLWRTLIETFQTSPAKRPVTAAQPTARTPERPISSVKNSNGRAGPSG